MVIDIVTTTIVACATFTICLVEDRWQPGSRSAQFTYPRAGSVKGESIGKTPLDLYRANIQSPVFQQQSENFRFNFQIQSTAM